MHYRLIRKQSLPVSPQQLWHFLSRPENLNQITPQWLDFEIRSELPERMYNGLLVEYRVRLPIVGRQRWLTEIKHIEEGVSFVDEQRLGPYRLWYHFHHVAADPDHPGHTVMSDEITYEPPFWLLGDLAHVIIIRQQLRQIFDYRREALDRLFRATATILGGG